MRGLWRRMLLVVVAATAPLWLSVPTATAQDDPFSVDDVTEQEQAVADGGLIEKFFIATRTDMDGEQKVEWLGSLVIWFLLLLSMTISPICRTSLSSSLLSLLPSRVRSEKPTRPPAFNSISRTCAPST